MIPRYFDAHSHLYFSQYENDGADVLARMEEYGVQTLTVGTNLRTSQQAVDFVNDRDGFFATIGLHPSDTNEEQFDASAFKELLDSGKVVGVGECGLDYYRNDPTDMKMKVRQHEQFKQQIAFSIDHNLPLMLHCRPSKGTMDAYTDAISILKQFPNSRGNVHFFVGDTTIARDFLEIGFTLSFTGVLTFARDYDEVARFVPLASILTETDAPFASPIPHRGARNEPAFVVEVVRALAHVREEDEEVVRKAVVDNANRVFGLRAGVAS